jgi:hypothetical protein
MGKVIVIGLGFGTFLILTVLCFIAIGMVNPDLFKELLEKLSQIAKAVQP